MRRAGSAVAIATLVALSIATAPAALAAPAADARASSHVIPGGVRPSDPLGDPLGDPSVADRQSVPAGTSAVAVTGSGIGSLFAIGFIASISAVLLSVLRRPERERR